MIRVGIVGGSGYAGGELLRLLLFHPEVEVTQITSRSEALDVTASSLFIRTCAAFREFQFIQPDASWKPCDVLISRPCRMAAVSREIEHYADSCAPTLIDLSADFRLE